MSHFEIFGIFKWCLQMDLVMYSNYINKYIIYVIIKYTNVYFFFFLK